MNDGISMTEEWKPVVGFPGYEVSNTGGVRSYRHANGFRAKPLVLRGIIDRDGYRRVNLSLDGGRKVKQGIHKLVALAFIGPQPSPRHNVAHNDGSRSNNRVANLRWATFEENEADKVLHGTHLRGCTTNGKHSAGRRCRARA